MQLMPAIVEASQLQPGDIATICGRPETVDLVQADAPGWVRVYASGSSDPFLFPASQYVPAQRPA
jgi:hypothetical protein